MRGATMAMRSHTRRRHPDKADCNDAAEKKGAREQPAGDEGKMKWHDDSPMEPVDRR